MAQSNDAAREYIADMCQQLATLARENKLEMTAHLLEMAKRSASDEIEDQRQIAKSH